MKYDIPARSWRYFSVTFLMWSVRGLTSLTQAQTQRYTHVTVSFSLLTLSVPSERNEQFLEASCIQCLQVCLVVASKCGVKVMSVFKAYNLDLINLAMKRLHNVWIITAIYSGVSGPYIHSEQIRLVDCRVRFKDLSPRSRDFSCAGKFTLYGTEL